MPERRNTLLHRTLDHVHKGTLVDALPPNPEGEEWPWDALISMFPKVRRMGKDPQTICYEGEYQVEGNILNRSGWTLDVSGPTVFSERVINSRMPRRRMGLRHESGLYARVYVLAGAAPIVMSSEDEEYGLGTFKVTSLQPRDEDLLDYMRHELGLNRLRHLGNAAINSLALAVQADNPQLAPIEK